MGLFILKNNVPWGPFGRGQIEEGLARGDFSLESPARREGQDAWRPLRMVLQEDAPVSPPLPPLPLRPTNRPPPLPGAPLMGRGLVPVAPPWGSEREPVTAGLIARAFALLLDLAILFLPLVFLLALSALALLLSGWGHHPEPALWRERWALLQRNGRALLFATAIGHGWIYSAGFESSRWQGTLGKNWLGLKIVGPDGGRIGFFRASARLLGKYGTVLLLPLSLIGVLVTARRLFPHDLLAKTRVVRQ